MLLLVCIPLLIFCIAVFSPLVQKASRKDTENEENIRVHFQDMLEKIALFKIGSMEKKLERICALAEEPKWGTHPERKWPDCRNPCTKRMEMNMI